jgi:hypothetical protein
MGARVYRQRTRRLFCRALFAAALIGAAIPVLPVSQAAAQCAAAGTNQTCTNPAGTTVAPNGIVDNGTPTVTNFGTISGGNTGIAAFVSANVTNAGTISGGFNAGIFAFTGNANVTNSGTITGGGYGIYAGNNANVVNSGTISAASASGVAGIFASNAVNVTNSGTISGPTGVTTNGLGSVLTNSGTIIGTNGPAIDFSFAGNDTLNFLPGSRIVGEILLGTNETINIRTGHDIAWLLTFGCPCGGAGIVGTGSLVNVTGGAPFVVSGNQVATLDPTAFGLADRTLVDFTGNVSSLVNNRLGEIASGGSTGSGASAFALTGGVADAASAAFAGIPSIASSYAAGGSGPGVVPNTTVVDRTTGMALWTKGFVGARKQDADGPMLAANAIAYGGAMGVDGKVTSDLRLGAFVGVGQGQLSVDLSSQTIDTNYLFGGIYGRFDWTSRFLDFAVSTGHSTNSSNRLVANNLAPTGLETATASYDGWFVSPELAYGVRIPVDGVMVTPTARLRYVAGFFDGYSETGSAQNLTVSNRTVQDIEERLEVALSRTAPFLYGFLKTTATVGVLGLERLGDTTVNTLLIGQNLAFAAPGQNDAAGFYAGIGFDYRATERINLFTAAEGTMMTDKSRTGSARGGVRVAF